MVQSWQPLDNARSAQTCLGELNLSSSPAKSVVGGLLKPKNSHVSAPRAKHAKNHLASAPGLTWFGVWSGSPVSRAAALVLSLSRCLRDVQSWLGFAMGARLLVPPCSGSSAMKGSLCWAPLSGVLSACDSVTGAGHAALQLQLRFCPSRRHLPKEVRGWKLFCLLPPLLLSEKLVVAKCRNKKCAADLICVLKVFGRLSRTEAHSPRRTMQSGGPLQRAAKSRWVRSPQGVKPRRPRSRRGFTPQPENSKRAHFRAPAFKNTTKIQREDPPEREEKNEFFGGRGKKRAKFWAVLGKGGPGEPPSPPLSPLPPFNPPPPL